MAPLSIQIYVVGPVQTNCYFAINDDTKEVLIIDPQHLILFVFVVLGDSTYIIIAQIWGLVNAFFDFRKKKNHAD